MVTAAMQQRLEECLLDQEWRLDNLYRITSKDGREIPFRMNDAQRDFYRSLWYYNVILKSRRLGFSTLIQLLMLDMCLFHPNTNCGVIAQSLDDAKAIFNEKIKFAYDRLPPEIRDKVVARTDSAQELSFSNGSKIRVGTSLRGGTLQALHVSEYGKIGAHYPDKAKEIRTGALNTVDAGQFIFIESTAEGVGGEFYELVEKARKVRDEGIKKTPLDPKLFFYPWFRDPDCELPETGVFTPSRLKEYFKTVEEAEGVTLNPRQRAWYVKKEAQMGDDMRREFPSTDKEPFEVAVDGAYYAREMARVRKEGRICRIPIETAVPVNTFWDLGRNDLNAIWCHQQVGKENRFVGYYQNGGESLGHYVAWLKDWLPPGCVWGEHYLPHDASVVELGNLENDSREEVIQKLGLRDTIIVDRVKHLGDGIQAARDVFASCWFDAENCAEGIKCLDGYRKDWNEALGVWRDHPRKTEFNHGADAFRQFAQGYDREQWGSYSDLELPEENWVL